MQRRNPYPNIDRHLRSQRGGDGTLNGAATVIRRAAARAAPGAPMGSILEQDKALPGNVLDPRRLEQFRASDHPTDSPQVLRRTPRAVYDPGNYGDMVIFPLTFLAAGNLVALQRPRGTRILLLVVNDLAAGQMRVNFGAEANAQLGLPLNPGGSLFLDSRVSQNDVNVWSSGAGLAQIGYINTDIVNSVAGT